MCPYDGLVHCGVEGAAQPHCVEGEAQQLLEEPKPPTLDCQPSSPGYLWRRRWGVTERESVAGPQVLVLFRFLIWVTWGPPTGDSSWS